MLGFFRKYQKYFFIVITIIIICSFSFFGTYSALGKNEVKDAVAFRAIDGKEIKSSELKEMVAFLSTDSDDKRNFGGAWGPNFLNDGVISKDFLSTGLAEILVAAYPEDVSAELQSKLQKEKRFVPYSHPRAKFLSADAVWNYFSPDIKTNIERLKLSENPTDRPSFSARVDLFLSEKKFPAPILQQVLRYQEKQYEWLAPDPALARSDLSLFGYHFTQDWFGTQFLRLVAEFMINSSKLAEQKGYQVTKDEALASLLYNSELSFKENLNNPNLNVSSNSEYFYEQLRRLNMDQSKAIKIWRQILLSRRLFQDVGSAALIDPLAYQAFYGYSKEGVKGDLYRLPKELQLANFRALQKFEIYLDAVAKRTDQEKATVDLPQLYLKVEEVEKAYPELVQKQYLLNVAQVSTRDLQAKVSLRETWNWEVEDSHWKILKLQFPELGIKNAETREERFAALDSLESKTRARVDSFSRAAIVDEHPEWLQEALKNAEAKKSIAGLRVSGGHSFVTGLKDRKELIQLLDKEPLAAEKPSDTLAQFTADHETYYRIQVLDRAANKEILTFDEANREGVLDELLDHQLDAYYLKIRENSPQGFQNEDKTWKPFSDVQDLVAEQYFAGILRAIRRNYTASVAPEKKQVEPSLDLAASLRFYSHLNKKQKEFAQHSESIASQIQQPIENSESHDELKLNAKASLADQWKIEKVNYETDRSRDDQLMDQQELFALNVDSWTKVYTYPNGDLYFFQLKEKKKIPDSEILSEKMNEAHQLLSNDAQQIFMHEILKMIKEKNAISLDYLKYAVDPVDSVDSIDSVDGNEG